jgi:propionyl-CoA carboxylase beta chain
MNNTSSFPKKAFSNKTLKKILYGHFEIFTHRKVCRGVNCRQQIVTGEDTVPRDKKQTENAKGSRQLLKQVEVARADVLDDGRTDAIARQHARGKLSARERMSLLFDDGGFIEVGSLVKPRKETEHHRDLVAPADGIITGYGSVARRPVSAMDLDFTVLGGSTGRHGTLKMLRAIQRSIDHGIPLVLLLEGGGHRIQDGQDSRHFAGAAPTLNLLARLSGWTPVASAILVSGFAGPTTYAALSDFVVMIRGGSSLGMAGPALVKAGTGEDIDEETLGGAAKQVDQYGIADLAVDTELEAITAIQRYLSYLPNNARNDPPIEPSNDPPNRRDVTLLEIVPANLRKTYDVREVIARISDKESVFEIKPTHADNIITALTRLSGRPVGIIANQPLNLAGMLDTDACEKAAHFIAVCDAFGLPLIFLIDLPGFAIGSEAEQTKLGLRSARMLYELSLATVPRISVVLRKGYGAGYYAMAEGRTFEADATVCWPTAEICAMSVEGSVDVAYRRKYEAAPDPEAHRHELIESFKKQISVFRAAEGFGRFSVNI